MLVPFNLNCHDDKCAAGQWVEVQHQEGSLDWKCDRCGHQNFASFDTTFTIGAKLIRKSAYEFQQKRDYETSIVFSAMAFEAEVTWAYIKWRRIHDLDAGKLENDGRYEDDLRRLGRIDDKINEVARFLYEPGIDEFARRTAGFSDIETRFSDLKIGSLATGFQTALFWKRNAILHGGKTRFQEADALRCYNLAQIGISLFDELEKKHRLDFSERKSD